MLFGDGPKGNEFAHAGISENNVDSPLHLGDGVVETIKVGQLGDVALNSRNVGADSLHGLVEFLLATARYEDIGTLFDEKFCRSEPNPFRSAGDDGGLAFELFGHCLSPLLLSYPLGRRTRNDPTNPFQNKPALSGTLARATSTVFRASLNSLILPFSATRRAKKS